MPPYWAPRSCRAARRGPTGVRGRGRARMGARRRAVAGRCGERALRAAGSRRRVGDGAAARPDVRPSVVGWMGRAGELLRRGRGGDRCSRAVGAPEGGVAGRARGHPHPARSQAARAAPRPDQLSAPLRASADLRLRPVRAGSGSPSLRVPARCVGPEGRHGHGGRAPAAGGRSPSCGCRPRRRAGRPCGARGSRTRRKAPAASRSSCWAGG